MGAPAGLREKGQIPSRLSAGHADGPSDRSLSLFFFPTGYLGLGVYQFWIPSRTRLLSLQRPNGGPHASSWPSVASREKRAL